MSALPVVTTRPRSQDARGGGCGDQCGAGLEKIYPTMAVRHGAMNWIGEFEYKPGTVFKCGARVVIQTDRGIELGEQVSVSCGGCSHAVSREQIKRYVENSGPEFYRLRAGRILREATPQDIEESERLNATLMEDIEHAQLLAAQMNLDLKVITCEHLLGGERIVFYFRADGRVDFRELVRALAKHHQTRIELRQVGARDEARLVADYEICGRECCCKNFLKKLRPVTMKMAKLQKSTLDPSKVSGRCGRLRCCLRYEHEGYEELARKLPRIGATVETQYGSARVVDRQILTQLVLVRCRTTGASTPCRWRKSVDPRARNRVSGLKRRKSSAAPTRRRANRRRLATTNARGGDANAGVPAGGADGKQMTRDKRTAPGATLPIKARGNLRRTAVMSAAVRTNRAENAGGGDGADVRVATEAAKDRAARATADHASEHPRAMREAYGNGKPRKQL
ncbi:MAG: hypothetical protein D6744_17625 [Planctomycetota bacterium]|nr:MAG: hypothetical protein D6744_17625 [Planctomycetota bacterium]